MKVGSECAYVKVSAIAPSDQLIRWRHGKFIVYAKVIKGFKPEYCGQYIEYRDDVLVVRLYKCSKR